MERDQGCQMVSFHTKIITNLGIFWRVLNEKFWLKFICNYLEYFTVILHILAILLSYISRFCILDQEKSGNPERGLFSLFKPNSQEA
jgi:hypothetical protein